MTSAGDNDFSTLNEILSSDEVVKQAVIERHAAETNLAQIQSRMAELHLARAQREETIDKQSALYNNVLIMDGPVVHETAAQWMGNLRYMHETNPHQPITVYMTTPGGDTIHGFAMFDYLNWLRSTGHHITITVLGSAFSMGSILLQAADHRVMGRESWLMLHQQQIGHGGGSLGDQIDMTEYLSSAFERVLDIYAERACIATGDTAEDARAAIKLQIGTGRRNWFLNSAEALRFGLVDAVL